MDARPPAADSGRLRSERGASAVEFALVAPILIALLLGVTTTGLTWSRSVSLSESVRAGARFGATTVSSGSWGTAVRDRVVASSADGLTSSQVCAKLLRGPTLTVAQQSSPCTIPMPTVPASVSASLTATDCLTVVWAQRPSQITAPPFASWSYNLRRTAFERYERNPC